MPRKVRGSGGVSVRHRTSPLAPCVHRASAGGAHLPGRKQSSASVLAAPKIPIALSDEQGNGWTCEHVRDGREVADPCAGAAAGAEPGPSRAPHHAIRQPTSFHRRGRPTTRVPGCPAGRYRNCPGDP